MARHLLHGLVVETLHEGPRDPAAAMLAGLPGAPGGAPVDVRILTRVRRPGPVRGLPVTVQGELSMHEDGEALRVFVPGASVEIRGACVDAWVADDAPAAPVEIAHHVALMAALRHHGLYHLHAAAVVLRSGAVLLLPGESGCGKSTVATALVAAGAGYLGDDVVLVTRREGALRLLAFPRELHLAPASARAIPGAEALADDRRTALGKHRIDGGALFPGRARQEAPAPAVILLPRIADAARTTVCPATPAAALGRLLESSAWVAARGPATSGHLAALAALVDGAAHLEVALGRDLLEDAVGTAGRLAAEALA